MDKSTRFGDSRRNEPPPRSPAGKPTDDVVDPVDEAVDETFPASDPPSWSPVSHVGPPPAKRKSVPKKDGKS